jgi:hypothetical protein
MLSSNGNNTQTVLNIPEPHISSPVKKGQRPVAGHDRKEIERCVVPKVTQDIELEDMWKLLVAKKKRKNFEKCKELPKLSTEDYCDYSNRLSEEKTCFMFLDIAAPLMSEKTPQDALIVIYDLLEGKLLCSHVFYILTASSNSLLVQETVNFAPEYQRWQCYDQP